MIWRARAVRTPPQIEVEREYVSKFEFALRKRCLPSESLKLLESNKNPSLRTISLDSIPWAYDQHHMTPRPASDFPWYEADKLVWLDGDWCVRIKPGTSWSRPGGLAMSMTPYKYRAYELSPLDYFRDDYWELDNEDKDDDEDGSKGPLAWVPYLVYLGVEEVGKVWSDCRSYDGTFEF
jgi:hypothetical protein